MLELLMVLGLIVLIFSIGFPAVHRMYVRNELTAGARQLQGELYQTRLEAMKAGGAYVFRYQIGTPNFELVPKKVFDQAQTEQVGIGATAVGFDTLENDSSGSVTDWGGEFSDPFAASPTEPPSETVITTSSGAIYRKSLQGNIVFGVSSSGAAAGWSTPILFYPNGRTTEASLVLLTTGHFSFRQELHLRGLTGTASLVEK